MTITKINGCNSKTLIVIAGPTASGKTSLAIHLAKILNTEIVSADSRQFYREMNIGTAKPNEEQLTEVKHHFIGHLSINDRYDVSRYETDALALLQLLFENHDYVILCGGSGLYIDAVTKGIDVLPDPDPKIREQLMSLYAKKGIESIQSLLKSVDPEYYNVVDILNPVRLVRAIEVFYMTGEKYSVLRKGKFKPRDFNIKKYVLSVPREQLIVNIGDRVDQMIDLGLVKEVESLLPYRKFTALNTVGYKELFNYLDGKCTLQFAIDKIKTNTRRYAKRQVTWFKRDKEYYWIEPARLINLF